MNARLFRRSLLFGLLLLPAAGRLPAIVPETTSPVDARGFAHPDLYIPNHVQPVSLLPAPLGSRLALDLGVLGIPAGAGFYDLRAGRWGTLLPGRPLVPGGGAGNALTWVALGISAPGDDAAYGRAAWRELVDYLAAFQAQLGVDAAQLSSAPHLAVHEGRRIVQVHAPRVIGGVPVRDSFLNAVVNGGNLVLLGTRNWGPVAVSTQPAITAEEAEAVVAAHLAGFTLDGEWRKPRLEIVPLANGADLSRVTVGDGYRYRLAWVISPRVEGDPGSWEALVDAHSGELLLFGDRNQYLEQYLERRAVGGIFPVSNDGQAPDGLEQAGYPLPFADASSNGAPAGFTNAHGRASASGVLGTTLSGRFVKIVDTCGPIAETAACSDLDLSTSAGTDCTVPAGHSAGDTHSARSGFYEVNRIIAQAKAYLPGNAWLQQQLTANMNLNQTCNAFWGGGTINFYRSGPHPTANISCGNTGEIAAVFDHEWGHGLDNNDNIPDVSTPGEAYADIAALFRLNASCIGRGFYLNGLKCGGNGDPCTECSGVREDDWAKRRSGKPHDVDWVLGQNAEVPGSCATVSVPPPIPTLQTGPCNFGTHCEGQVVGEAFWDLYSRDLQGFGGSPFDLEANTALEIATRLFYLSAGNVNNWYQCVGLDTGLGGCNADGGYLNLLAIDDDNGLLLDGTPHMEAIFRAFDRHQIACALPAVQSSGCALGPSAAPAATAAPGPGSVRLSWNAVPGATAYWVFRTEGVRGFDFGKERIAIVTGTEHADEGLLDGFQYFYGVMAVGANGACLGPMSAGVPAVPEALASTSGPALGAKPAADPYVPGSGDGDELADNCEQGSYRFRVENEGGVPLANVRIVRVTPVSHPGTEVTTPLPAAVAASLPAACGSPQAGADASFAFVGHGLAPGDTIRFEVELTADELAPGSVVETFELRQAETDWVREAVRRFGFEEGQDGWQVARGTFGRSQLAGGAQGSSGYLASSAATDNACDQVRSPVFRLTPSSTLSLWNQFTIEPNTGSWFDRANVALFDPATGDRVPVAPDGGRLYNASGAGGNCVTADQEGWADVGLEWQESTFSAAALDTAGRAGRPLRLDVAYGTDTNASLAGFWLDEVTLTDVEVHGPDAQSDSCVICSSIDDADAGVEYRGGWHRIDDPAAPGGGYHRRMGSKKGGAAPVARLVFAGDEVTYSFARSSAGGTADVYLDGALRETLSYRSGDASPTFGHAVTYGGLGAGRHELRIEHRSGAAYVDGFTTCRGGGADAAAVHYRSETQASAGQIGIGGVLTRTVEVGAADEEVSVVVEGMALPLTVQLRNPLGDLVGSGTALIDGLATSGLDAVPGAPGTYTVRILNTLGLPVGVEVSVARTVRVQ